MGKWFLFSLFGLLSGGFSLCADSPTDVVGYWKSIDEQTGKAQSVVAIYEHDGKYYGRLVVTFDDNGQIQDSIEEPKKRAPGVVGDPYYSGLDFIWDLQKNDSKLTNGQILDPEQGKIYNAQMWRDGNNLIVRGEILFFGRNQTWPPAQEEDFPQGFTKPDLKALTPTIPEVKDNL